MNVPYFHINLDNKDEKKTTGPTLKRLEFRHVDGEVFG